MLVSDLLLVELAPRNDLIHIQLCFECNRWVVGASKAGGWSQLVPLSPQSPPLPQANKLMKHSTNFKFYRTIRAFQTICKLEFNHIIRQFVLPVREF